MSKEYTRRAYHAGSWYSDDAHVLKEELDSFLFDANDQLSTTTTEEGNGSTRRSGLPRGIIAPHAGYSYSGPTAGYSYSGLREAIMRGWKGTVVVLHPSHHVYLDGCAVSGKNKKYQFITS